MQPHNTTDFSTDSGVPLHTDAPLNNRQGTTCNLGVHHDWSGSTSGKITFRVIEGKFAPQGIQDLSKMHLYCKIKLGWHTKKTAVANMEGDSANWGGEAISLKVIDQEQAKLKIKDKAGHLIDKTLGHAHIHLKDIILVRKLTKWVPIIKKDQLVGEVHLEMKFHPQTPGM